MFNEMSNPAFNNTSFTQCNILFMEPEKEMHPSMLRFYEAMKALKGVEGQSAAAKVLNMSPQKLNNWESRGISAEAAIEVECTIGCRAAWLRNGNGEMLSPNVVIDRAQPLVARDPVPENIQAIMDDLSKIDPDEAELWRMNLMVMAKKARNENRRETDQYEPRRKSR